MYDPQVVEAIRTKDEIGALVGQAGWKRLAEILEEREAALLNALLDPGVDISEITMREHRMAINTLRTLKRLPEALLEDAQSIIDTAKLNETDDEERVD